ncbi:hypothetical protein [Embleya sp. NPDC005971]|uniref:hypothetical protein n=1 Tax=Embleya sp. NPDC005971 TaxID=3156724 RepID=UPI0034112F7F
MFVRSTLPGSGLGYVWHGPGDVVEMSEAEAEELCSIEPDRFEAFHDDPRTGKETKAEKEAREKTEREKQEADDKAPAKKTAASRTKAVTESD